jgi:ribosomal protein S18 acetylase RimI-like enzyme
MHHITFEFCDFNKKEHQQALTSLLNHYMSDPMGNHPPHDEHKQSLLLKGLSNHPTAFVLFLLCDGRYTGMATCFVNYSTFKLKPYLYVHDVVVCKEHRSKGFGKALIQKLVEISKERDYCKITLEVREDNPSAQSVYRSIGFEECDPRMLFWEKQV